MFLPDFNYETIQKTIKQQEEARCEKIKQQVEKILKRIHDQVMGDIENGNSFTAFTFPDDPDISIRKRVVDEICARFPKRVSFWWDAERKYVYLHEYTGVPPIAREYKIKFD